MTTEQIARGGFVETEPAGVGFYAGPPSFDVSHGELVLTAHDFHRFRCSLTGGWVGGDRVWTTWG
jgi:hypothetical protein